MQFHNKRSLGADIKDSSIYLMEVSYYKRDYQLEHSLTCPIEEITLIAHQFKMKNIVLSISDAHVLTKKICLGAKLSAKEKREYIALEMEKLVLCPREELYFAYKVLKKLDHNRLEILCATVRRDVIDTYIDVFKNTLFKVKKITYDSEIAHHYTNNGDKNYQKARAIALSGFEKESLNFLPKDQKYSFNLTILILILLILTGIFLFWSFQVKPTFIEQKTMIPSKVVKISHPLPVSPFKAFKMLGKIEDNEKIWGVIQTPEGQIIHVQRGDIVGAKKARVATILPDKILLSKNKRRYVIE